jgi:hypothetical protein
MLGGAAVDGRAPPRGVLRQVRGDIDLAKLGDAVGCVEALVTTQGDLPWAAGVQFRKVQRGQPLGMTGSARGERIDDQAMAVLCKRMAHEAELRLLARPLAVQPGILVSDRGVGVVAALLAAEVLLGPDPRRVVIVGLSGGGAMAGAMLAPSAARIVVARRAIPCNAQWAPGPLHTRSEGTWPPVRC